jgi:alpha-L-rhamnosidase
VINFLHRVVAGIQSAEPGYKRITIHPQPGGGLTSASASYESVNGLIASSWVIENGHMRLDVSIPANTRAEVILPGAKAGLVTESSLPLDNPIQVGEDTKVEIGSGSYRFDYRLD